MYPEKNLVLTTYELRVYVLYVHPVLTTLAQKRRKGEERNRMSRKVYRKWGAKAQVWSFTCKKKKRKIVFGAACIRAKLARKQGCSSNSWCGYVENGQKSYHPFVRSAWKESLFLLQTRPESILNEAQISYVETFSFSFSETLNRAKKKKSSNNISRLERKWMETLEP